MRNPYRIIKQYITIENILFFLFSFELYDNHHFVLFGLFAYLFVKGKLSNYSQNSNFYLLLLFGVFYYIFTSNPWSSLQVPSWLCAFIIGYCYANKGNNTNEFKPLLLIAVGYALEGLLTVYLAEGVDFAIDEESRFVDSLWGSSKRSISAQNVIMYLYSGILIYILSRKDIGITVKIAAVIFDLGFVYNTIMIAMRSSLIFNPLIILAAFAAYNGLKVRAKTGLIALLIVVLLFALYSFDFGGIKSYYESSYLFTRLTDEADGGISNNSRFYLHRSFFDLYKIDMFGGLHNKIQFYFHNLWLDMYSFSGVIPFVLFGLVTIKVIKDFLYIFRRIGCAERSLYTGTFAAFMLPFYMDPMLWAAPAFFTFFIMYWGMLTGKRSMLERSKL